MNNHHHIQMMRLTNAQSPPVRKITNLSVASFTEDSITLTWTNPRSTNPLDYFKIEIDGVFFENTTDATEGWTIGGLDYNTAYPNITLTAVDDQANEGLPSNTVSQTTALGSFITTWETTTPDESITIPTTGGNYTVYWGDGTITQWNTGDATHTYAVAGIYTVRISGTFPRVFFNNGGDKLKIKSIEQWGSNKWAALQNGFWGCTNLYLNATDIPDLSSLSTLNFARIFQGCINVNADIGNWDTSSVTSMNAVFLGATNFNGDIRGWDVSNVRNFQQIFEGTNFNQDIGGWDTSNITNMARMFDSATNFNQDLSGWNFENVDNIARFLRLVELSTPNYDALLISMASQNLNFGLDFHGGNSKYSPAAEAARDTLVNDFGWTVVDGGPV